MMIDYLIEPFFHYLPHDLAGLASAMVWGQKQFLTKELYQIWQSTGLLHLLVLSGQNITLLVNFLQVFTKYFGRQWQLLTTIGVALFYLTIFGAEAPIVRASMMAILASLVAIEQTTTPPIFLLFVTALIMLFFRPHWLSDLSFQLSLSATLGILLFYPYFSKRLALKSGLTSLFFLSFSAQLLTTPLLLVYFRQVSLLALPINTFVALLIEPIMFIGVATSLIGQIFPFLLPFLSLILFGLLSLLNQIVNFFYPLSLIIKIRI